jgi:hypothetical protein
MLIYIAAAALLALAVILLAVAWLAGHRTPLPHGLNPGWFYFPSGGLVLVAGLMFLLPSLGAWNGCADQCDAEIPEIKAQIDRCVSSAVASAVSEARRRNENMTEADFAALRERKTPESQTTCENLIVNTCVTTCFDGWKNPQTAEAPAP